MPLVYFLSLGCDKNLSDSESMMGLLAEAGYSFTADPAQAEVIIVNTCAFIGDAKQESIEAILELARHKEQGNCRALLAAGCLAERYRTEILKELPELDGVLGTASYHHILEAVEKALARTEKVSCFDALDTLPLVKPRVLSTGGHYAYLKIADGCDKHCTYCAIPQARGGFRSYPMEYLLEQAGMLAERGVRELILVAQESTLYGRDLYGKPSLTDLIRRLEEIDDIRWIRLLYGYPEDIDEELIDLMARSEKLCSYLDLPIQHASDRILKLMGRRTDQESLRRLIGILRDRVPGITLRTTLMTGFPGETEEDHAINLAFVKEMAFDRLGVFCYSREEGTGAYGLRPQVPKRVKEKRRREIMEAQQALAFERARRMVGQKLKVMVEGRVPEENIYVARTEGDAPDVDGLLFFEDEQNRESGDFLRMIVTGARDYDLIGEVIDEPAE